MTPDEKLDYIIKRVDAIVAEIGAGEQKLNDVNKRLDYVVRMLEQIGGPGPATD
jgi:flagellin-like hook-associated protein FlgL